MTYGTSAISNQVQLFSDILIVSGLENHYTSGLEKPYIPYITVVSRGNCTRFYCQRKLGGVNIAGQTVVQTAWPSRTPRALE
jgi:hypothetical protein